MYHDDKLAIYHAGIDCIRSYVPSHYKDSIRDRIWNIVKKVRTPEDALYLERRKKCQSIVKQVCANNVLLKSFCKCFKMGIEPICIRTISRRRLVMAEKGKKRYP
jgi:hypothetical protein